MSRFRECSLSSLNKNYKAGDGLWQVKLDWGPGSLEKSLPDVTTHHVVVQLLSRVRLFVTPWTAPHQASLSFTSPGACSNSCPSSQWCHPTISSSVVTFSSCLQSLPASGSFPMSQFFTPGGQSIGASASASVFPMSIQGWFPLPLTGLISFQSKESGETLKSLLQHYSSKASILWPLASYGPPLTSTRDYWKYHSFDYMDGPVGRVMFLLFNTLSRLVIAFLSRSMCLLISWL